METIEYGTYGIKVTSREEASGNWLARWTADRLSGSGAPSKSGFLRATFTTQREADEAALHEARAWVDNTGHGPRIGRSRVPSPP